MIMHRCIVEGCTSGLLNNTKKNETHNARQNLLFKVPNDPNMLNKWCTALGQIVKPGDKVCDVHFKEDDILKNLSTFSKIKGQETLKVRKRVILKQGAIPVPIMVIKDPLKLQKSNYQQKIEVVYLSEDEEQSNNISDKFITDLPQQSIGNSIEKIKADKMDQDPLSQTIKTHIVQISYKDGSQEAKQQSTKEKITANYVENGAVTMHVIKSLKTDNKNNQTQKLCRKRKPSNTFSADNKLSKLNASPPNTPTGKISKSVYQYGPTKLISCFDELKCIVQQKCIRQQWCVKIEQNSVLFYYVDFNTARVNCCLEVTQHFKVNAYTADKVIAIYVTTTDGIRSIMEIVEIMKVLEKKRWCLGPGIPAVSRSADCVGAMSPKSASDNCIACIKEKLNSLTHTRELANCRIKLEESRHKYELMRKKHHYVNTQYERLKAENKILESQVDEAKKLAVNEVINRLPILQQCVIRYIINSSYVAKSSVRYCESWINECLVMRAMSPAMYEYMRHKEILPLPCPDTLKKHKFKVKTDENLKSRDSDDSIDYSQLPESPEMPDPVELIKSAEVIDSAEIYEYPEVIESVEVPESSEVPEPTNNEIPELTNSDNNDPIYIAPECILSEDVAYEVTVCTEPNEVEQC